LTPGSGAGANATEVARISNVRATFAARPGAVSSVSSATNKISMWRASGRQFALELRWTSQYGSKVTAERYEDREIGEGAHRLVPRDEMEDPCLAAYRCRGVMDVAAHERIGKAHGIGLVLQHQRRSGGVQAQRPYASTSQ